MLIRNSRYMSLLLILLIVFPISHISKQFSVELWSIDTSISMEYRDSPSQLEPEISAFSVLRSQDIWTLSETHTALSASGTIDSIPIEQIGYSGTGSVSARTDMMENINNTLNIDTLHDWVASEANATVTNLKRLYAVNGTFDEGIPGVNENPSGVVSNYPYGWTSDSYSSNPSTIQRSSYIQSQTDFVSLENEGDITGTGSNTRFVHAIDTRVTWSQMIDNRPYSEDFVFSLNFLYLNGPLDISLDDVICLEVWMGGTRYWNQSLPELGSRDVWYSSGAINVSIVGAPAAFEFDVRLAINSDLALYPTEYGFLDSNYLTVMIDDVVLTGSTPPTPEQVDLTFNAGSASDAVTESLGVGTCIITNSSYWSVSSLPVSFDSNASISFDYNVKLLNHRFVNSSWTTDILEQGVAYVIDSGKNSILEIYTYLGYYGIYEDLILKIFHPSDWENFTIRDPFLSDVSSSCTFGSQVITIPESILDRLGWWKVTCDAPNYASSAEVERYDLVSPGWVNESIFHSFDLARLSVSIGTLFETPVISDPVNFTWVSPNCTVWFESSSSGGLGSATSPTITFGPTNTTAGIWGVRYLWSNGSELAYRCYDFALHHTAVLELVFSDTLSTVVGQPVTVVLKFQDAETGQYLLNDGASIVGQWAGTDVFFTSDLVNNWWQADFDTAEVGAGEFIVNIISSAPYFETAPLEITITSHFLTTLDAPTGPLTPLIYGREYSFDYFYAMSYNGTGIDGAIVEVSEEGSEWTSVENSGNGHYNLTLIPLEPSDYSIRVRFSKIGFENQTHVLSFLVNDVAIEVASISTLVGSEYSPLNIEVQIVESDTRNLVSDANVTLAIYRPGDLLHFDTLMDEANPGVYTTSVIMPEAGSGTYTVRISIEKDHHEMTQDFSATLVPLVDTSTRLIQTMITYRWQIAILSTFAAAAVAGQRVRSRRRREKHTKAVQIKNRFDDANNILGFLVLHKLSGVPIYSKVFKGGFEEGLLSAFITATMHFREEMNSTGVSQTYGLLPISDVIRTVPTKNLICAFITITPPSTEQESRMISYTRAIGMMFDDTLAQTSAEVIDTKTSKSIEWLFDDLMDGSLVRRYQRGEKTFPRSLKFIEKAISLEESDGSFDLVRLVRLLTSTQISEDDVYIKIVKLLEEDYIVPCYPYNNEELSKSE
ncbi:MAG: hypothetical protein ACFFDM_06400 [Candidatus Thorarchaeota archaeon]